MSYEKKPSCRAVICGSKRVPDFGLEQPLAINIAKTQSAMAIRLSKLHISAFLEVTIEVPNSATKERVRNNFPIWEQCVIGVSGRLGDGLGLLNFGGGLDGALRRTDRTTYDGPVRVAQ